MDIWTWDWSGDDPCLDGVVSAAPVLDGGWEAVGEKRSRSGQGTE